MFTYEIVDGEHEHFYITTDTNTDGRKVGVLRIKEVGIRSVIRWEMQAFLHLNSHEIPA